MKLKKNWSIGVGGGGLNPSLKILKKIWSIGEGGLNPSLIGAVKIRFLLENKSYFRHNKLPLHCTCLTDRENPQKSGVNCVTVKVMTRNLRLIVRFLCKVVDPDLCRVCGSEAVREGRG